jgi:hypothetical protein
MGIETLLLRLDGVKATGIDAWKAKCPAHPDKSPSLAIKALGDGRILLHDFAGCAAVDIVAALGLAMSDLFPQALTRSHLPRVRGAFSAWDALKALSAESSIIAIAAADIVAGKQLSAADLDRVSMATGRIATALEACL